MSRADHLSRGVLPSVLCLSVTVKTLYRDADKSLAPPTSRFILFDGENNLFDASLVVYVCVYIYIYIYIYIYTHILVLIYIYIYIYLI